MSRLSRGSSVSLGNEGNDDQGLPPTPRQGQAYLNNNYRDSFMTTTSATTETTTTSSTFTGSLSGTSMSGDSSSRRISDRRTSSYSSVVQSEILELEDMIYKFKEQLDFHKRRADTEERRANDAEKKLQEYAEHLAKVNKARLVAQQEANTANEELRLYKLQLEYAQREINRAQSVLDLVDKQRHTAEKEASEAKAKARKLNEELIVENARREGRRQGLQEGLTRGRDLILRETEGMNTQRRLSSVVDRGSFTTESFGSDSDSRTISTESHVSILADRRPRDRRHSYVPTEPSSPLPLPVPEPRPGYRATSAAHELPPSGAPSATHEVLPSRAPSVAYENPSRSPPVAYEHPHRVTSPTIGHSGSRPASAQGYSSISRPNMFIPPDNLIPNVEMDGVIRLPPPHGFHKPPHTPEQYPSPSLPPIPPQQFDSHPPVQPHPSPESASTTLSHLELLKDPSHGHVAVTPALSAIEEVSSQASPYPSYDFRRQSMAGSSVRRGSTTGSPYVDYSQGSQVGTHHRARSTSSFAPSIHERPPSVASRASKRSGQGTPIHINVQPPSQPVSEGTQSISKSQQLSPLSHDAAPFSSSFSTHSTKSPAGSSTHTMPEGILESRAAPSPVQSVPAGKDDDAVSSRISGDDDFFTTPPPSGPPRNFSKHSDSVVSAASAKTSKTSKSSKYKASKASRNR